MEAEQSHEHGREGVAMFKRWLESTTYIELNWTVYEKPQFCTLPLVKGRKKFDMVGEFIGSDQRPIAVECKRYSSARDQGNAFHRFLAEAYSSTVKEIDDRAGDIKREFIWATTHPFSVTAWATLHNADSVRAAVAAHPDVLVEASTDPPIMDDDLVQKVAERVWLLILNEKQDSLSLTKSEVLNVWQVLKRKEGGI